MPDRKIRNFVISEAVGNVIKNIATTTFVEDGSIVYFMNRKALSFISVVNRSSASSGYYITVLSVNKKRLLVSADLHSFLVSIN